MARRPQRPCRAIDCKQLHRNPHSYCDTHVNLVKEWRKQPGESGRGGRPWRRVREQVLERDGYLCQCEDCKKRPLPLVAHEVDHISNKRGIDGKLNDDPSNLRSVNRDCHKRITQEQAMKGRKHT